MWLKEGLDFTSGEYNNKTFTTTVNVYADTEVTTERNVYTAKYTKGIENKEPNSVIMGKTEIKTAEIYKKLTSQSSARSSRLTAPLIEGEPSASFNFSPSNSHL